MNTAITRRALLAGVSATAATAFLAVPTRALAVGIGTASVLRRTVPGAGRLDVQPFDVEQFVPTRYLPIGTHELAAAVSGRLAQERPGAPGDHQGSRPHHQLPQVSQNRAQQRQPDQIVFSGYRGSAFRAAPPLIGRGQPGCMWGVYSHDVPWNMQTLTNFEHAVGKASGIVHFTNSWVTGGKWNNFPWNDFRTIWQHGSYPMLGWSSWDTAGQSSARPDSPEWRTAVIADGAYDGYIRAWARDAKAWGLPFFLRPDWEMNGLWRFPWCEPNNGNEPGDYVRMWRHLHDIFTSEGVTNVTWVWNPNVHSINAMPLESLYPGDDYVDWTAYDGYNWGSDAGNLWQTFHEVYSGSFAYGGFNSYAEMLQLAPSKPMMICEVATSVHGGPLGNLSAAAWITDALEVQIPQHYPKIRAVCWVNDNFGDPNITWPIVGPGLTAFRQAIASPYYGKNLRSSAWTPRGKILPEVQH